MNKNGHREEVRKWLEENVITFDTPQAITIDNIQFDSSKFEGSFSVCLDEIRLKDRFDISLGIDGLTTWHGPMFTSPLGAPASYSAIELPDVVCHAISKALNQLFPKMAAFGLHPTTGQFINSSTPLSERVLDVSGLDKTVQLIKGGKASVKISCSEL